MFEVDSRFVSVNDFRDAHPDIPEGKVLSEYTEALGAHTQAKIDTLGITREDLHNLPPHQIELGRLAAETQLFDGQAAA